MTRSSLLLLGLMPLMAFCQPFQWTTYTSTSNTVDLISYEGSIWTATSGGLSAYNVNEQQFDVYTNTRGLAMNQSTAVGHDDRGWIWIAFTDGRITRLHPPTGQVRQIVALEGEVFDVHRILSVGSSVFVAANNGIYRFEYNSIPDNYIVRESIKVLGGFPSEAEVLDIAASGGYLYASTTHGLARAELSIGSLGAPASWENITTTNSNLPQNQIRRLFSASDGKLWLAGPEYTYWYNGADFQTIIQFNDPIEGFAETAEGIFAATEYRVYQFTGDNWLGVGSQINSITGLTAAEIENVSRLFVGVGDSDSRSGGILLFDPENPGEPIHAPGIGGNQIRDVALDSKGDLWVATTTDRRGVSRFDGIEWHDIIRDADFDHHYLLFNPRNIVFDEFGGTWVSNQGGGVLWIRGDTLQVFDHTDASGFDGNGPRLDGVGVNNAYVITRAASNAEGDIYLWNRIGYDGTGPALIRISSSWISQGNHSEPWEYFYPPVAVSGSLPTELEEIMIDNMDRIWIGAVGGANDYSYVLVDGGAVADSSDDEWFFFNPASYQDDMTCFPDIQPDILTWAVDQQNYLWIGTESGAFYLQGGLPRTLSDNMNFICLFDMPIGQRVNDIYVDSQDNKWFATDEGVAVLDKSFAWIHVFQTASSVDNASDLTSKGVTSITSNPQTGEFWIGTTDGLSHLSTPYVSRVMDLDEVWPYPNPFLADGSQKLFIDPKRLGGRFDDARIFTISGRLVRELTWTEMISNGWDGRNGDGELVAGGVYLVVTTSADGNSATGKVAVLGR